MGPLYSSFMLYLYIFITWCFHSSRAAPAVDPRLDSLRGANSLLGNHLAQNDQSPSPTSGSLRGPSSLLGNDGNPINPSNIATVSGYSLVPGQTADPKLGLYLDFTQVEKPQPLRGNMGGTDPGPQNVNYDSINSDLFAAPGTDSGDVPNAKWPMGLSHNRLGLKQAGWARQQNQAVLPAATAMAGVDMHLEPHAYRELHWHKANEWNLILRGSCRITAMNEDGKYYMDDLNEGDVWFFPSGAPHSIQALDQGVEFLLIFDDGSFSEEGTSLISEMFLRNPHSVLAKDLQTDVSAFQNLPSDQLYIFPGTPAPSNISEQNVTGPAGYLAPEDAYTYHFSQVEGLNVAGGNVKIVDPEVFPIASKFSAAIVTIQPGAMREIHWHLTSDEWNFFLQGQGRVTVFDPPESSRTFDFEAGDVGYVPVAQSHYIENTGTEDLKFLEVLQAPKFTDISAAQWMGLTPKQVIKDTLQLPDEVIDCLPKTKPYILPGNPNMTTTNFTVGCEGTSK